MMKKTAIRAATTVMPPGPPERSERVESLPGVTGWAFAFVRLRQKETARQEIEAVQGCRGEERSVGGETAHQPTEHRSRDHPEPETGAHEAEVPRALIAISDIGNISAGYRPSRPGDAVPRSARYREPKGKAPSP